MYKKVSGRTSVSPPGVELVASKYWYVSNIILYWNEKIDSFMGWRLPKLPIISNNGSNKSCWELNLVQKSRWTYMSISARSGARGLERSMYFKYLLHWNGKVVSLSRWRNYRLYQKIVQIKIIQNEILYKKVTRRICLSPTRVELGGSKDCHL